MPPFGFLFPDSSFKVAGFGPPIPSRYCSASFGRVRGTMPRQAQRRQGTSERDDAVLIARSGNGETEAFEQLMAKYANLVGSIAYNIVGDVHVAGDITQDTFLKVFRNLKNLEDPRRFKGWLCSIVRTTCVDWLRKERVKPTSLEKITDEGLEPEGEFIG